MTRFRCTEYAPGTPFDAAVLQDEFLWRSRGIRTTSEGKTQYLDCNFRNRLGCAARKRIKSTNQCVQVIYENGHNHDAPARYRRRDQQARFREEIERRTREGQQPLTIAVDLTANNTDAPSLRHIQYRAREARKQELDEDQYLMQCDSVITYIRKPQLIILMSTPGEFSNAPLFSARS